MGGGRITGGTGLVKSTAARAGVIPVCCCSLRGGYGAFGMFLDKEILVAGVACCYSSRAELT